MKLLSVISTLNPSYGGPVESLRQFEACVGKFGHEHHILTLDSPDCAWVKECAGKVSAVGPSFGMYGFNASVNSWLLANAGKYDAIIVRGIWQYHGFAVRRVAMAMGIPYFVFVHGALDPWFKVHYPLKHAKKWLYWPWAEYRVLRDASAVLFTSDEERRLARQSFWLYKAKEAVVDYGIGAPDIGDAQAATEAFYVAHPETREKRLILFMSRLHEKKGCDLLIRAFAHVAKFNTSLHLVMAGPDQEGWKERLSALATSLCIDAKITWTGLLVGPIKWGAYYASEVFVLPSHSENFGIVVAEALACGRTVLVTDKVNIWKKIVEDGAGIVMPDTYEGIQGLLEQWLSLSGSDREKMSERASICFERHFEIHQAVKALLDVIDSRVKSYRADNVCSVI